MIPNVLNCIIVPVVLVSVFLLIHKIIVDDRRSEKNGI